MRAGLDDTLIDFIWPAFSVCLSCFFVSAWTIPSMDSNPLPKSLPAVCFCSHKIICEIISPFLPGLNFHPPPPNSLHALLLRKWGKKFNFFLLCVIEFDENSEGKCENIYRFDWVTPSEPLVSFSAVVIDWGIRGGGRFKMSFVFFCVGRVGISSMPHENKRFLGKWQLCA